MLVGTLDALSQAAHPAWYAVCSIDPCCRAHATQDVARDGLPGHHREPENTIPPDGVHIFFREPISRCHSMLTQRVIQHHPDDASCQAALAPRAIRPRARPLGLARASPWHPTRMVRHLRAVSVTGQPRPPGPRVAKGVPKTRPGAMPMTRCAMGRGHEPKPCPGAMIPRAGPLSRPSAGRASRSTGRAMTHRAMGRARPKQRPCHDAGRHRPGPWLGAYQGASYRGHGPCQGAAQAGRWGRHLPRAPLACQVVT